MPHLKGAALSGDRGPGLSNPDLEELKILIFV